MQNRVMKKFLSKLWPPAVGMIYVLLALELGSYFTNPLQSIAVVGLMIVVPMVGYILYETWQQAKREVEQENEIMMRALKDS